MECKKVSLSLKATTKQKIRISRLYTNRYACNICGTDVIFKLNPSNPRCRYGIYCPKCDITLMSGGDIEDLSAKALKAGYIRPIDKPKTDG